MIYYLLNGKGEIVKGTLSASFAMEAASAKGYQVLACGKVLDRVAFNAKVKKVSKK